MNPLFVNNNLGSDLTDNFFRNDQLFRPAVCLPHQGQGNKRKIIPVRKPLSFSFSNLNQ